MSRIASTVAGARRGKNCHTEPEQGGGRVDQTAESWLTSRAEAIGRTHPGPRAPAPA